MKENIKLYSWGFPIIGLIISFTLGCIFQVGNSSLGIMLILGIIAGYLALISFILMEH